MNDWPDANDLASEITHGTAFIDMMSPEPPNEPTERKTTGNKSAPPLNLKNLRSDSGSINSKPSSPAMFYGDASPDGDSFAAGSAVNLIRKVKSSGVPSGRQ